MTGRTAAYAGAPGFADYSVDLAAKTVRIHSRTARPFVIGTLSWPAQYAGQALEDLGRAFAREQAVPAAEAAGLPGGELEAWLLPVTSFTLEYMIVPAETP